MDWNVNGDKEWRRRCKNDHSMYENIFIENKKQQNRQYICLLHFIKNKKQEPFHWWPSIIIGQQVGMGQKNGVHLCGRLWFPTSIWKSNTRPFQTNRNVVLDFHDVCILTNMIVTTSGLLPGSCAVITCVNIYNLGILGKLHFDALQFIEYLVNSICQECQATW